MSEDQKIVWTISSLYPETLKDNPMVKYLIEEGHEVHFERASWWDLLDDWKDLFDHETIPINCMDFSRHKD